MKTIRFTVDSALFRELGERLVGRPHIALAELVKNSYDADATSVDIWVGDERIEIVDNGHGMTFEEFRDYWMRVGSPHKQEKRVSPGLGRRMTGSKGVGRLSAQFLAKRIEVMTVSTSTPDNELYAVVDWPEAVDAGELTQAVARYREAPRESTFSRDTRHGTRILLTDLNQVWDAHALVNLAKEIWWLQPPFGRTPEEASTEASAFEVQLRGQDPEAVQKFEAQMEAYHDIWHARLLGRVEPESPASKQSRRVKIFLEFAGAQQVSLDFDAPVHCPRTVDFEIRIYHLQYRQPKGIRVGEAREYFKDHGGIHVYDAGFHLPYYGPDNDWLNIEMDHSHRLARSKLLPADLQVPEGLTYLPTQSRILGVVRVDTALEQQLADQDGRDASGDYLKIQVTRDRLVDNEAYQALREVVRWGIDLYAMEEAKRVLKEAEAKKPVEPVSRKFQRVDDVLTHFKEVIPGDAYSTLQDHVREAISASESEAEARASQVGLLGGLATAGMSALAYEHESHQQLLQLRGIGEDLDLLASSDDTEKSRERLKDAAHRIREWIENAQARRRLFTHLLDQENRETQARLRAHAVVERVYGQMRLFFRDIAFTTADVDSDLRLPPARYMDWSAILQNVFLNAINAMLDSDERFLTVSSYDRGKERGLLISDTGVGVDIRQSEELFEPFTRRLNVSQDRRELGLGGTGLGLTIVRMLAENIGCTTAFVAPEPGFSTTFQLSWTEVE